MKMFDVEVSRKPVQSCVIRVEAVSGAEAEEKALATAGDQEYNTSTVQFEVAIATEVSDTLDAGSQLTERNPISAANINAGECSHDNKNDEPSRMTDGSCARCGKPNVFLARRESKSTTSILGREEIEGLAIQASVDNLTLLTPYALQRLEVFANLVLKRNQLN